MPPQDQPDPRLIVNGRRAPVPSKRAVEITTAAANTPQSKRKGPIQSKPIPKPKAISLKAASTKGIAKPVDGLTAAEQKKLAELQKKASAASIKRKEQHDSDSRQRSRAMLEAEDEASIEDEEAAEEDKLNDDDERPARRRRTHSPTPTLDEDEAELANTLGPIDTLVDEVGGVDDVMIGGDSVSVIGKGQDEPSTSKASDDGEDDQVEDTLPEMFETDLDVTEGVQKSKSAGKKKAKDNAEGKTGKTTLKDFTPTSRKLAAASKTYARKELAYVNPFPSDKDTFSWGAVKSAAKALKSTQMAQAVEKATKDDDRRELFIDYAYYAVNAYRGAAKDIAAGQLAAHYHIPGDMSPEETADLVQWLIAGATFAYGDLDLEERTRDENQPLSHPIIADVIRLLHFGKGKADLPAFQQLVKDKIIPKAMILLVITAIENALKVWALGDERPLAFTDQVAKPRYKHHEADWDLLEEQTPTWMRSMRRDLFSKILKRANKGFLGDMADRSGNLAKADFAAMEAAAVAAAAAADGVTDGTAAET